MIIEYEVKNFKHEEFYCKCKDPLCSMKAGNDMDEALMVALDIVRKLYRKPIKINSGKRCGKHNKAVGGAMNSKHTLCRAVDISGSDFADLRNCVSEISYYFGLKVIVYDKEKFIHIERS